jgi:hypothetical protein
MFGYPGVKRISIVEYQGTESDRKPRCSIQRKHLSYRALQNPELLMPRDRQLELGDELFHGNNKGILEIEDKGLPPEKGDDSGGETPQQEMPRYRGGYTQQRDARPRRRGGASEVR